MTAERDYHVQPYPTFLTPEGGLEERLYIFSPDRTKFIDPYVYFFLTEAQGRVEAESDVDAAVVLVDLRRRLSMGLLFCGTPCGFDDAVWVDNDTFVVTGWSEQWDTCGEGDPRCTYVALLWVYHLSANRVSKYIGPQVRRAGHSELGRQGLQAYVWRKLREKFPNLREPE